MAAEPRNPVSGTVTPTDSRSSFWLVSGVLWEEIRRTLAAMPVRVTAGVVAASEPRVRKS